MQKISFGNKEYVKASAVAKQFRYTQDYVGQLCRSKKIDARLVGRVWYVEPDSVAAYRKTKHSTQKSTASKSVPFNRTTKRTSNPKPVTAVMRAKTLRSTQRPPATGPQVTKVTYSPDDEVSIPILGKSKVAQSLPVTSVTQAPTPQVAPEKKPVQKIKIKKTGPKKTNFKTEKLPEISLSGKLKVNETSDDIERAEQQKITNELKKSTPTPQLVPKQTVPSPLTRQPIAATTRTVAPAAKSAPKAIETTQGRFTPRKATVKAVGSRPNFFYSDRFLVASLVLGVCSALAILSLASLGEISSTSNNSWSVFLNFEQLRNLLP